MIEERQAAHPICMRCLVAGQVQGVFFRATTRRQAQDLGLTGHARNLPDGRVEVLVCGEPEAVKQLTEWLRRGPSGAVVTGVSCSPAAYRVLPGFTTG